MRIRNMNRCNQKIRLRSTGETISEVSEHKGEGIFDVPEADAKLLMASEKSGWSPVIVRRARPLAGPITGIQNPPLKPAAPLQTPDPVLPSVPNTEETGEGTEDDEGPDLEAMTKAALLETAETYGIEVDPKWTKAQLVEALDAAIYGEKTPENES